MNRLNLAQRLGIVLSLLWIVTMGGSTWFLGSTAARYGAETAERSCLQRSAGGARTAVALAQCRATGYEPVYADGRRDAIGAAAKAALLPLPFFWAFGFLLVLTVRWVLAGQAQQGLGLRRRHTDQPAG